MDVVWECQSFAFAAGLTASYKSVAWGHAFSTNQSNQEYLLVKYKTKEEEEEGRYNEGSI